MCDKNASFIFKYFKCAKYASQVLMPSFDNVYVGRARWNLKIFLTTNFPAMNFTHDEFS